MDYSRSLLLLLPVVAACQLPDDEWYAKQSLSDARWRHVAASGTLVDGAPRVFVFGGQSHSSLVVDVDAYDPLFDTWDPPGTYPAMPTARLDPAVATGPDGRIYVIGGFSLGAGRLASVDVFDPQAAVGTNPWSTIADMSTARFRAGATFGPDGLLYVIGGVSSGNNGLTAVERYNPSCNEWDSLPSLPRGYADTIGAAVGCSGEILAIGARTWHPNGQCTSETWAYDPTTPSGWTPRQSMPGCLAGGGVVRAPNDQIYVVNDGNYFASGGDRRTYVYDSHNDTWSEGPATNTGGTQLGVAALDPWIFAIGGTSKFALPGHDPGIRVESLLTGSDSICPSPPVWIGAIGPDDEPANAAEPPTSEPHQCTHPATPVLQFDGDDRVTVSASATDDSTEVGDFTLEAWIRIASEGELSPRSTILSNRGPSEEGFSFFIQTTGEQMAAAVAMQVGERQWVALDSPPVVDERWHHMAARRDGGVLSYFVDGLPVAEFQLESSESIASAHDLWIGADAMLRGEAGFRGSIAEVRIWDVARSDDALELAAQTGSVEHEAGLINHWRFDEGQGQGLSDAAGDSAGVLGATPSVEPSDPSWVEQQPVPWRRSEP